MKKVFIGVVIGIFISAATVYAANVIFASSVSYSTAKNANIKNVEDALNDLYTKNGHAVIDISFNDSYTFPIICSTCTYKSSDENILKMNGNVASAQKSGTVTLDVVKDEKTVLSYKVKTVVDAFKVTGTSQIYSMSSSGVGASTVQTKITDGITYKQGGYGALMFLGGSYITFETVQKLNISFASNSYSDSGGISGKTITFYKKDSSNNWVSYKTLTQLNNNSRYGSMAFEAGTYKAVCNGDYCEFDEWFIEPVD